MVEQEPGLAGDLNITIGERNNIQSIKIKKQSQPGQERDRAGTACCYSTSACECSWQCSPEMMQIHTCFGVVHDACSPCMALPHIITVFTCQE